MQINRHKKKYIPPVSEEVYPMTEDTLQRVIDVSDGETNEQLSKHKHMDDFEDEGITDWE